MGTFLAIFGSLGLFLFGMRMLSESLQKFSGHQLREFLRSMTKNRFRGLLCGVGITSLIQSSSATTVMVVSFVNAGLLTLMESAGIILGANIGTTMTAWIISLFGFKFSITSMAVPLAGIGMALILFGRKPRWRDFGECLIGFGILFLGLGLLKESVPEVSPDSPLLSFISDHSAQGMLSVLLFVGLGVLLTIVVQSSSAAMAITITMAAKGWIGYDLAAAIVLGENIGTTITANLAALAGNLNAKRAALLHFFINIFGVIWVIALFGPFSELVVQFVPGVVSDPSAWIAVYLAAFHTIFNVINVSVLIGFTPLLVRLVKSIGKDPEPSTVRFEHISTTAASTGSLNVVEAELETSRLAKMGLEIFDIFVDLFENPGPKGKGRFKKAAQLEEDCDHLAFDITRFLTHCSTNKLSEEKADDVTVLFMTIAELEEVSDACYRLAQISDRRSREGIIIEPSMEERLRALMRHLRDFIQFVHFATQEKTSVASMETAIRYRDGVKNSIKALRQKQTQIMHRNGDIDSGMMTIDLLNYLKAVNSDLFNIMQGLCRRG
ncbi:Na/Pi cotransporter family protein [Puniceicoccus vermicola]|uniref:Na/Pi cotransporter family protein n=1 Tax=Puniceicoccus vermicola TaxID=388746 RepID=A0A7X1E415_9BACT|nr:Na/Pi cotransporter family protein [Puniceicoccus vermicola]MBC2601518.1 Na/Pi cotransporter family protein [Puniceicoccus vermicola]